jgi:hypothetical protein
VSASVLFVEQYWRRVQVAGHGQNESTAKTRPSCRPRRSNVSADGFICSAATAAADRIKAGIDRSWHVPHRCVVTCLNAPHEGVSDGHELGAELCFESGCWLVLEFERWQVQSRYTSVHAQLHACVAQLGRVGGVHRLDGSGGKCSAGPMGPTESASTPTPPPARATAVARRACWTSLAPLHATSWVALAAEREPYF